MNSTGPKSESLPRRPRWTFVLLLYPFVLYALLTSGYAFSEWLGLFSLGTLILFPVLSDGKPLAWAGLVAIGAIAIYAVVNDNRALINNLPQILICSFLMLVFGRTLLPGRIPLITRISHAMRKGQSEVPLRYTRGLTIAWVIMFALLVIEALLLTIFETDLALGRISMVTYTVILAALVGEYCYHTWRYPNPAQRSLADFIRQLIQIDYRRLLSD